MRSHPARREGCLKGSVGPILLYTKKTASKFLLRRFFLCAQNRTRTCTYLRTLVPETSASTNFAIWADVGIVKKMVPRTRVELAQAYAHYPLKVACLPISPPGHFFIKTFWKLPKNAVIRFSKCLAKVKNLSLHARQIFHFFHPTCICCWYYGFRGFAVCYFFFVWLLLLSICW